MSNSQESQKPNIIGNCDDTSPKNQNDDLLHSDEDNDSNHDVVTKDKELEEEIIRLFDKPLKHHKTSASSKQKKVPRYLQQLIGEANNLYTFGKFDEAIPLFEHILKQMPSLADVTHTMSLIYTELRDYEKAYTYAQMSALSAQKDTEKWQHCAQIAMR